LTPVGFRYALRWADGDDAGEAEYPDGVIQVGEQIRINGNQLVRVRAVIPAELAAEFVDGRSTARWRSSRCDELGRRASGSPDAPQNDTVRMRRAPALRSSSAPYRVGFRVAMLETQPM
jgi:hypothetical protein